MSGGMDNGTDFIVNLDGFLLLLTKEAECCERPMTTWEAEKVMKSCTKGRLLSYELYTSMPDLFADLLADVYCNWQ